MVRTVAGAMKESLTHVAFMGDGGRQKVDHREHTIPVPLFQTYEPRAGMKYGHHWDTWDSKPNTDSDGRHQHRHTGRKKNKTKQTALIFVPPPPSQTCGPEAEKTA